ncbi:MAG: hypothetical protein ACETWQ_14245 [Phycisphaerae bacterium]
MITLTIYDYPDNSEAIRQGDIFLGIPKVEIEFASGLPIPTAESEVETIPWEDIVKKGVSETAVLPVLPVPAIVASQDCDARWGDSITLCEIREFSEIEKDAAMAKSARMIKIITRQARWKLKWFYLPPDETIGFDKRMGVDFFSTMRVPREDLEKLIELRKARLKPVACDHFRERIAHFYRRYAYNEWYPLNKEEMGIYSKDHTVEPSDFYDWQK